MKKYAQIICLFLLASGNMFSQQEKGIVGTNNWLTYWSEFNPGTQEYGEPTQILSGNIDKDTKLFKREVYLLLGDVFVTDSTTLTIEPGTVILGDFKKKGSLTITKGSKIIANGTQTDPIIFSSNKDVKKKGDWGGLFILGDAPVSTLGNGSTVNFGLRPSDYGMIRYGGDRPESNSGILKYVRIEFAGKRTKQHGYFNGLTLAGVGNETLIENVMVSYCQGNSVSVLGGDVYMDKMVSFRSNIEDYKFNLGTQCTITNSLAVRSPYVSNSKGARTLFVASHHDAPDADLSKQRTVVTAENLTLVNISEDLEADLSVGLVKEGIYIDEGASLSISKSVISGFNPAVILDNRIVINSESLENMSFTKMYFNNCNGNIFTKYNSNNEDLENWYGNSAFFNLYSKDTDSEMFIDSANLKNPDFRLRINKIIASKEK